MDGKTQIPPPLPVWTCSSKPPAWVSRAAAVDIPWVQNNLPPHILPLIIIIQAGGSFPSYFYKCIALFAADHVSHLENVSEDEINRLLGMVVDVENLFMSVHKEEDTDTKQVYFYLFKVSMHVYSM